MKERLTILYDNNVIDQDVYEICVRLHDTFMIEKGFIDAEAYTVAMTHVAMAMNRVKSGDVVNPMDEMILNELKGHKCFVLVKKDVEDIVDHFSFTVPDSELQYLWLHFLNIYNEKGGCN